MPFDTRTSSTCFAFAILFRVDSDNPPCPSLLLVRTPLPPASAGRGIELPHPSFGGRRASPRARYNRQNAWPEQGRIVGVIQTPFPAFGSIRLLQYVCRKRQKGLAERFEALLRCVRLCGRPVRFGIENEPRKHLGGLDERRPLPPRSRRKKSMNSRRSSNLDRRSTRCMAARAIHPIAVAWIPTASGSSSFDALSGSTRTPDAVIALRTSCPHAEPVAEESA